MGTTQQLILKASNESEKIVVMGSITCMREIAPSLLKRILRQIVIKDATPLTPPSA